MLAACNDNDSFSAGGKLSFDTDTLRMDTCFSNVPVAHKVAMAYNNSGDGIRISSIRMERRNATGFRVNVNGTYLGEETGYKTNDIMEIRNGDSLRIFVEMTAHSNTDTIPKKIDDNVIFTMEDGSEQRLPLSAYAWDAILMRNTILKKDSVLSNPHGKPLVVFGTLTVDTNAVVTIAPGTTMYFHSGAGINVNGTLKCLGEKENEVTLRCDRLDRMVSNLTYDNNPGQWEGIRLNSVSHDNVIGFTDIHGASYGVIADSALNKEQTMLTLHHATIHNIEGDGLSTINNNITIENTQISNCLGNCVSIEGGNVTMTHCTIVQYYPFDSNRGWALALTKSENPEALQNISIRNSIIKGYEDDVIVWYEDIDTEKVAFHNCLLRTSTTAEYEGMFKDCEFENVTDEQTTGVNSFKLFDTENFFYDFTPKPDTYPIGKANEEFTLPDDRYGRPRHTDRPHDLGCLESEE